MFCWSEVSSATAAWGFCVALCAGSASEYICIYYMCGYIHAINLPQVVIHTSTFTYFLCDTVYHDMCNSPACMYMYIHLCMCVHTHTCLYHTKQPTLEASPLSSFQTLKQHSSPNILLQGINVSLLILEILPNTAILSAGHELWLITLLHFDIEIKLVLKRQIQH